MQTSMQDWEWACAMAEADYAFERSYLAPDEAELECRRVPTARHELQINGVTLFPCESEDGVFGSTGGELWAAGRALATWVLTHPHVVETADAVVELGAGLGLPGIVAARFNERVVLTDNDPGVLANLERTLQKNDVNAAVAKLDWCRPADLGLRGDVLYLAAACVYTPHLGIALADTLHASPFHWTAVVVQRHDRPGFADFRSRLDDLGIACETLNVEDGLGVYRLVQT